jgi:hypothetical protein
MAYGWIMLKLKDFEGIYATAYQRQSHLLGEWDCLFLLCVLCGFARNYFL